MINLLIFTLDGKKYALDLSHVKKVFLSVELNYIPHARAHIAGAISIHGQIVNVINMRTLLGLPSRELDVKDRFILCEHSDQFCALWVDSVEKISSCTPEELIATDSSHLILKNDEHMTLFFDLKKLMVPACNSN